MIEEMEGDFHTFERMDSEVFTIISPHCSLNFKWTIMILK